jgi:hypothetical protein
VAQAQVQAEAAQRAQAAGEPADGLVPVQRPPSRAAGRPALLIETVGQLGDRLLEAPPDGREMPFVVGDQPWIGLGGEVVWKIKRAGGQRVHNQLRSEAACPYAGLGRRFCAITGVLPQVPQFVIC